VSPYSSYLIETLVTLVGVCALAWAVLYGARKVGMGRDSGGLELVGRLALDARRSIALVKIGETVLVIGVGDGGMTKLGELPASSVPARVAPEPPSFASVLARVLQKDARAPGTKAGSDAPNEASEAPKP
jgi:flagellar biosynthetic protein FliO